MPPGKAKPAAKAKTKALDPRWVLPIRLAGLLFLAGFIPVILGVPVGRRLFWTVTIAALPLGFTVFGFHAWRRVCPLALAGQLGRFVKKPGTRKAGEWLAAHYLHVQLGVMIIALSLRLVATNGTPWALAGFLGAIVTAAAVVSFLYTGKTWCNYLCPIGLVEKVYNEPLRREANSQCAPCTACKKNCPDIDLELGYWKEAQSPARRHVYYAWPGVVLGFYTYFWLVTGRWSYYFSGEWTREADEVQKLAGVGFFFAPAVPRWLAAPLTLCLFGLGSFALFSLGERLAGGWLKRLKPEQVRHRALALAGFTAFVLFYCFAGQPTLRLAPAFVQQAWAIVVVVVASLVLYRRWPRSEETYVHEKFARGILKRWEWGDEPPSDSLSDIYLIHTERTKQRETRLGAYKETIREMLADGVVTQNEVSILEKLRSQLGIASKDHEKILGELSAEEKKLFDPEYVGSSERRLQREQYRRDLERLVRVAARSGHAPEADALEALRAEHHIPAEEHEQAVATLRDANGPLVGQAREEMAEIQRLARAARRARLAAPEGARSLSVDFFAYLAGWREGQHVERALALLTPVVKDAPALSHAKGAWTAGRRAQAVEKLAAAKDDLCVALAAALGGPAEGAVESDADSLVAVAADGSPYLRAAAAYLMTRFDDEASRAAAIRASEDPSALVRETAVRALGARGRLTRQLVARAMADPDPRVVNAVMRAVLPGAGTPSQGDAPRPPLDPEALAQTLSGLGTVDPARFATVDKRAALESLSTLEKMALLRSVPLFAPLAPDDLEALSGITQERHYMAGKALCREGDDSNEVFVIVSGRVQAWVSGGPGGAARVLGESGEGSCVGEMAALDQGPRTAWVNALVDTRTLVVPGDPFRQLLLERPAIAQAVLGVVTARLRGMIAQQQKAMTA